MKVSIKTEYKTHQCYISCLTLFIKVYNYYYDYKSVTLLGIGWITTRQRHLQFNNFALQLFFLAIDRWKGSQQMGNVFIRFV